MEHLNNTINTTEKFAQTTTTEDLNDLQKNIDKIQGIAKILVRAEELGLEVKLKGESKSLQILFEGEVVISDINNIKNGFRETIEDYKDDIILKTYVKKQIEGLKDLPEANYLSDLKFFIKHEDLDKETDKKLGFTFFKKHLQLCNNGIYINLSAYGATRNEIKDFFEKAGDTKDFFERDK